MPKTLLLLPLTSLVEGDEATAKLCRQIVRRLGTELEDALADHGLRCRYLSPRGTSSEGKFGFVASTDLPAPSDLEALGRMYEAQLILSGRLGIGDKTLVLEIRLAEPGKGEIFAKRFDTYPTYFFDAIDEAKLRVAEWLRVDLSPAERTVLFQRTTDSWEAYLYFLFAEDERYLAEAKQPPVDQLHPLKLYEQALAIDPSFEMARAGMIHYYLLLLEHHSPEIATRLSALSILELVVASDVFLSLKEISG